MQTTKEKQRGFDIFLRIMIAVSAVFWIFSLSPYTVGTIYIFRIMYYGGILWFLGIKAAEVVFAVILFVYTIIKFRKITDTVIRRLFIYGLVLISSALCQALKMCDPPQKEGSSYLYYWRVWEWFFAVHELICSLLVLLCLFLMITKPKKSKHIGMIICIVAVLALSVVEVIVLVINMGGEGLLSFWFYGNWWKYVCYLSYCLWIKRMRCFKAIGTNVPGVARTYVGQNVIAKEPNRMTDIPCPECGKPYDKGDIFCGYCGYRFRKIVCPECGKEGNEGERFCNKCGIHLVEVWKMNESEQKEEPVVEEQLVTCITCGEKMPITNRFCIRCGTMVNEQK